MIPRTIQTIIPPVYFKLAESMYFPAFVTILAQKAQTYKLKGFDRHVEFKVLLTILATAGLFYFRAGSS
jgi:hypothetical protein